jgi:hypothetical protein
MKHLFISFILCTLTLSAFAQETDVNFALTANGATATATSGNPLLAMDDNIGTRWESEHKVDPQTFTIDLGQVRTFNTIQIVWEGAYAKDFTVSVSSDNAVWNQILKVEDQYIPTQLTQTHLIDATTARYVQFQGTERALDYGYSFFEFRVYLSGVSKLTTLEAKPAANISKVGEGIAINLTAKDQNGQIMTDAGEATYTILPADAGTITNNVYTPAKVGSALIKVAIGEVEATPLEVFAYDGENAAASASKESSKVIAQSDINPEIEANNAYYAVDGNDATIWQGCYNGEAGTNTEEDRTFDAWFVVDLGAYYDVNMVHILFEGACSQMYHVDFSEDNVTWNTTYTYEGNAAINAHARAIYGDDLQNASNVRYVRFWSTKAATQWGLKMYEFKVYGKVMKETALSDISVDEISAQKIISNGQLFLIRDGKLFNALGQSINQ